MFPYPANAARRVLTPQQRAVMGWGRRLGAMSPFDAHVGPSIRRGSVRSYFAAPVAENAWHEWEAPRPEPTRLAERTPYWQHIPAWRDVEEGKFLSYQWQTQNTIERREKLIKFLEGVLPQTITRVETGKAGAAGVMTREEFIADVEEGLRHAPMAVRLTPHMLSVADWTRPFEDPIRRQFIPMKSTMVRDHPALTLDSLHETEDSPVPGLVHRYPDRALFLATSVCPVYCRFCTRSYAVGAHTELVTKAAQKPTRRRWELVFDHLERVKEIRDVVVSGGDAYYLQPEQLRLIGERLLSIPHIQRIRFATKGLAVCPMRILDSHDGWADVLIHLSNMGRATGKQVALHTHFNHPHEVTWATELAARHLFAQGVIVRNQTVLLRGVNDDKKTMASLIHTLAGLNIQPYYVYQADMVRGVEDLRTPLRTILQLEQGIRGTVAGFMMPNFVVDLPGGGGKRLATSFENYDEQAGVSTWKAPGVTGDAVFTYHDPA